MKTALRLLGGTAVLVVCACTGSNVVDGPRSGGAGSGGSMAMQPVAGSSGSGGGPLDGGATAEPSGAGGLAGAAPHTGGTGGTGGTSGSTGAQIPDISGRWGMFAFEDPVGVQLVMGPDGTLVGQGCAAGAPGSPKFAEEIPGGTFYCGPISGKVTAEGAWFSFPLQPIQHLSGYSARVTISPDRRRMTGVFNNGAGDLPHPMAWLRVSDDAAWLPALSDLRSDDPLLGSYELSVVADASVGAEFVPGRPYLLQLFDRAIAGDLGSFWHTERSARSQGSPLRVGPVSPTARQLPTALALEFDAGTFTRVTATTASGGFYTFTATKVADR